MKRIITIALLSIFTFSANAQFFEKDINYVNAGYGLGIGYGRLLNAYQAYEGYKFSGFGPVAISYERGITDNIGLGVSIGYSSYGGRWLQTGYDYKYRWTTLSIMARGAYHFNVRNRQFDPYAGVGIGFLKYSYKWESNEPGFNEAAYNVDFGTPLAYQIFVGARYMFSDNFGAYAELGYGISVANAGITLAF
jgi:opacity protein-like surface antigen